VSIIAEALKKIERRRMSATTMSKSDTPVPLPSGQEAVAIKREPSRAPTRHRELAATVIALASVAGLALFSLNYFTKPKATFAQRPQQPPLQGASPALPERPASAKSAAPTQGSVLSLPILTKKDAELALNGIVYGQGEPVAIINNKVMWKGDSIQGAAIEEITPTSVTLLKSGRKILLELK